MTKVSKQEIIAIARTSRLDIYDNELDELVHNVEQVLSYAARVIEVAGGVQDETSTKNVNRVRPDVVISSDAQAILSRAPEREGDYFVVPRILESND